MKKWVEHFTSLLNKSLKPNTSIDQEIMDYIEINRDQIFNELNFKMEIQEFF